MKARLIWSLLALLATACSAKVESSAPAIGSDNPNSGQSAQESWKEYSTQPAAGKIMGVNWTAAMAVMKPSSDGKNLVVKIYGEKVVDACSSNAISNVPSATVVLPVSFAVGEYRMSTFSGNGNGNPLTFISGTNNAIAELTGFRIDAITDSGFLASVYAVANDPNNPSEINGRLDVIDCSKAFKLTKDWEDLAGTYQLATFDGQPVNRYVPAFMEIDTKSFFSEQLGRRVRTLKINLFDFVGNDSSSNISVGPMDGLGTGRIVTSNGTTVYTYSYQGPINSFGDKVQMTLNLTLRKTAGQFEVEYTVSIPEYRIEKTYHRFTLRK